MNNPDYTRRMDFDEQQYRQIVSAGVAAVKGGERPQARVLLRKAVEMKPTDPQPWIWLSATTDDLAEQRDYLEHAVAADPNNGAAKRGLVLLSEKLDRARLLAEGQGIVPRQPQQPEEATIAKTFTCPNCGGHMRYDHERGSLLCEFCGQAQAAPHQPAGEAAEQTLDFVLPTTRGHRWAEAQQRLECSQCGAISLLPPGQSSAECPYCGSRRLVESEESTELVDPQVIGLAKFDEKQAARRLRAWLGRGWFAPDDLRKLALTASLRRAYYPFWTFDGTLQMNWSCEVNQGTSRNANWVRRTGEEFQFFDDVLVPGLRKLKRDELKPIEPFKLKELVEFKPDYLAAWNAMTYDLSLADASLQARERVARLLRRQLYGRVLPGSEKRNVQSGAVNWSGMTFKLVMLPLWQGAYRYRGRSYRVWINGQTGKVGGAKPRDPLKITALILSVLFTLLVLGLMIYYLTLTQFS
jgi:DNA-directed RNA polymerase subunit RPC12/RpoP